MADVARADLAFRRVAGITGGVCIYARRDRLAGARGRMTRRTSLGWASLARIVCGVVKLHVKALFESRRKRTHRRRCRIHFVVTDRAHRGLFAGVCKLAEVTADARIVSRIFELFLLALAAMARNAVKLFMLDDVV